tara:strand:- start:51 stop:443 length:393 start_codon:yes stop_codon:yes gene_type:complete
MTWAHSTGPSCLLGASRFTSLSIMGWSRSSPLPIRASMICGGLPSSISSWTSLTRHSRTARPSGPSQGVNDEKSAVGRQQAVEHGQAVFEREHCQHGQGGWIEASKVELETLQLSVRPAAGLGYRGGAAF